MNRYAMILEYDGAKYSGWQHQKDNSSTIQFFINKSVSSFVNQNIVTYAAGRTDAGVHASYQVVHFDSDVSRSLYSWLLGINSYLPENIKVKWINTISNEFHARFSAISRTYSYYILNTRISSALLVNKVAWYPKVMDVDSMQLAANYLLGEHDFTSFRAKECQSKTAIRKISKIEINRYNEMIKIEITANAFLHNMVRNIVGSLIEVGVGNFPHFWVNEVLLAKNRSLAGPKACAHGLYLSNIEYPIEYQLPELESRTMEF